MFCRNCGTNVTNMKFCTKCGTPVMNVNEGGTEGKAEKAAANSSNNFLDKICLSMGGGSYERAGKICCICLLVIQGFHLLLTVLLPDSNTSWSIGSRIFLVFMDWRCLSKQGIRGAWKIWGIFVEPVYLLIRARKTSRKYGIAIASFLIILLGIGVILMTDTDGGIGQGIDAVRNNKGDVETGAARNNKGDVEKENKLPEYAFAVEGYVKIQRGEVESVNVKDYLPNKAMTLTYEFTDGGKSVQYYYNVYPEEEKVWYEGESLLDAFANIGGDSRYTSTGYYYYDTATGCLAEVSTNKLTGKEQNLAYLIPMGKSLKINEGVSIENVPYFFTVTCGAGVYKDCIAVYKSDTSTDTEISTVTYYAEGVGPVLTVTNSPNGGMDFRVTDILTEVKPTDEADYMDDADGIGNIENYFLEGQRFECFETNSGEDMMLTIYLFYHGDENGNIVSDIPSMYKGVMSDGLEFWFQPYEIGSDFITYKVDCADGSFAYLKYMTNMSAINISAENGMLYNYGGIYMGLPDSD